VEVACEGMTGDLACDTDMLSFKAYLTRSLAATTQLAPFTLVPIMAVFKASANAAALQCSGGANGRMCGLQWTKGAEWDGSQGAGQQMAAMEIVMSNMIGFVEAPVTSDTGGTSVGDPSAGTRPPIVKLEIVFEASKGDVAGAGLLTIFAISGMMALFVWMCRREVESENN
jgi:mannan endo-1,6-alpha-mannosidase